MNPQKRIRPLMGMKEIFSMPRVFYIPALLISFVFFTFRLMEESISLTTIGAAFAVLLFTGLASSTISFPFMYMGILIRTGVDGTAKIIAAEEREGTLLAPATAAYVTFEFTPQGKSAPIQLTAKVTKIESKLQAGGTAKIRYAKSKPRVVKFDGE